MSDSGIQKVLVNNKDISNEIRSPKVTAGVSTISAKAAVRDKLTSQQKSIGLKGGLVAEGRDIGTTVFPNADYKFYIDANIKVRAKRRFKEIDAENNHQNYENILKMMKKRDFYDQNREHSPLSMAKDAICIDTTDLSLNEQVDKIINIIKKAKEQKK